MDILIDKIRARIKTSEDVSVFKQYLIDYSHTNDWYRHVMSDIPRKGYYRNIIYRDSDFEVVIISWKRYAKTEWHSHPLKGCLMTVLYGSLDEIKLEQNKSFIDFKSLKPGQVNYVRPTDEHIISNSFNNISVSLHLYSPPGFYD